ncbi:MAG: lipopolysaccharide/colanic/teichoic acid biosynthesis glycosyltransferase [Chlamydiales bacterium]|jgi:lipopolysaccharide/colanic/teichoic acid biosynthesis glycosyltransferase
MIKAKTNKLPLLDSTYVARVRPVLSYATSLMLIGMLAPIGLCVALINLALFRDPRRILFIQERVGLNGRPFMILKFRTMRDLAPDSRCTPGSTDDICRVTCFGRFLRNTHIDELPQLINVLRGEMELIGPRPEMTSIESWAQARIPGFERRLVISPGVTGYAQVIQGYAPQEVDAYDRKCALNIEYLERISMRTDVWILIRTCVCVLSGRGWQFEPPAPASTPLESADMPEPEAPPTPRSLAHVVAEEPVGTGVDS